MYIAIICLNVGVGNIEDLISRYIEKNIAKKYCDITIYHDIFSISMILSYVLLFEQGDFQMWMILT